MTATRLVGPGIQAFGISLQLQRLSDLNVAADRPNGCTRDVQCSAAGAGCGIGLVCFGIRINITSGIMASVTMNMRWKTWV